MVVTTGSFVGGGRLRSENEEQGTMAEEEEYGSLWGLGGEVYGECLLSHQVHPRLS